MTAAIVPTHPMALAQTNENSVQGDQRSLAVMPDMFTGIALGPFSPEAQAILGAPLRDDEISVRPDDGILYMSGEAVRQRLQKAFGIGGWAIKPINTIVDREAVDMQGKSQPKVFFTGQLWAHGRFVAEATGDGNWITSNPKSDYGTALEGAKTNCISRCCKDIGMWSELRDKAWTEAWCAKNRINQQGKWMKRPSQPIRAAGEAAAMVPPPAVVPNVPKARVGGVGAIPKNTEHEDKGKHLREGYAAVMGAAVPPPDPEDNVAFRKGDKKATAKDLERVLAKSLPEVELAVIHSPGKLEVQDRNGDKTIEDQRTAEQNAHIHALRAELGYDKGSGMTDYREALWKYYGVRSSALLTVAQASDLIERLLKTQRNLNRGP